MNCFAVHDLSLCIFTYLSPTDLGSLRLVCKDFHSIIDSPLADQRLYQPYCRILQQGKVVIENSIGTACPLQFHVELIPIRRLEEILLGAKVDLSHVSDNELLTQNSSSYNNAYYRTFISFLLFGARSVSPPQDLPTGFSQRLRSGSKLLRCIKYPDWSYSLTPWKASYVFIKVDSKRNQILQSELCGFKWKFSFKYDDYPPDFEYVQFGSDHVLRSILNKNEQRVNDIADNDNDDIIDGREFNYAWEFPWKIITKRIASNSPYVHYPYNNNTHHKYIPEQHAAQKYIDIYARKLISKVKVDNYPTLSVSRLDNGLWQLENIYVTFTQIVDHVNTDDQQQHNVADSNLLYLV